MSGDVQHVADRHGSLLQPALINRRGQNDFKRGACAILLIVVEMLQVIRGDGQFVRVLQQEPR